MKHGDFTALAKNYAQYRPGYSPFVLDAFLGCASKPASALCCADVGAGTGIWTRQVLARGVTVDAVEPNDAMRTEGERQSAGLPVHWHAGSAEHTGLEPQQYNMVTMASSFHWPDFDESVKEFYRILLPNGLFMALWNTRRYESNPLLVDIENYLHTLVPGMKRISSGRSEFCATLTDRLLQCGSFSDVIYVEGRHTELQTPAHYIGLWESVNDVRVQAGEERFEKFIKYIRCVTSNVDQIEAEYTTRAWIARKKD